MEKDGSADPVPSPSRATLLAASRETEHTALVSKQMACHISRGPFKTRPHRRDTLRRTRLAAQRSFCAAVYTFSRTMNRRSTCGWISSPCLATIFAAHGWYQDRRSSTQLSTYSSRSSRQVCIFSRFRSAGFDCSIISISRPTWCIRRGSAARQGFSESLSQITLAWYSSPRPGWIRVVFCQAGEPETYEDIFASSLRHGRGLGRLALGEAGFMSDELGS